jgi:hypothetical protein
VIGGSLEIIRLLQDTIQYERALMASVKFHQYAVFEWIDQTLPEPLDRATLEKLLEQATVHNNLHVFEYYRERLDGTEEFLQRLLEDAFAVRHREIIFYLLDLIEERMEPAFLNKCLSIAANGCPLDTVRVLVEDYKCDVNTERDGWMPIQTAAKGGFLELVQYFASVPGVALNTGTEVAPPALLQAANDGLADVVAFLLTVPGIDVNARNSKGETALHCAARWNQMDVIKLLLQVPGIDLTIVEDRTVFSFLSCKLSSIRQSIGKSLICSHLSSITRQLT